MQTKMHSQIDKDLRDSVQRQLEWDPRISSADVAVTAKDGAVSLTGFVPSYFQKLAAAQVAGSVYGIRAVANDIEVKISGRTDPEIARDIAQAMKIDMSVPDDLIKATVVDGLVTLEGRVTWNFQREAAESCVSKVKGVRHIVNNVALKPPASTTEVKTKIENALRRDAEIDARRICVSASDGKVTLSGNIRSFGERDAAKRAAWAAPGVIDVVDEMVVVP